MNLEDIARNQAEITGALASALVAMASAIAESPGVDGAAFKEVLIERYSFCLDGASSPAARLLLSKLVEKTDQAIRTTG